MESLAHELTELPAEERGRADIYRLLAILLARAPDEPTRQVLVALTPDESDLGRALAALAAVARARAPAELSSEFDTLFLGMPTPRLTPYASWYRTGQLFGRPLAELRQDLKRLGIVRRAGASEPEDHIFALCETMSGLIVGALGSGPLPLDRQRAFFEAHIAPWAPRLFADLEAAEASTFYMAVGRVGRTFMALEADAFAMA